MKLIVSMAKVIFFLLDKYCIAGNFCSAYYRVSLSAARFWCCTRKTVVGNTWNWDVDYIWPCWSCNVQKSFWAITFLLVWVFWDDWAGNLKLKTTMVVTWYLIRCHSWNVLKDVTWILALHLVKSWALFSSKSFSDGKACVPINWAHIQISLTVFKITEVSDTNGAVLLQISLKRSPPTWSRSLFKCHLSTPTPLEWP